MPKHILILDKKIDFIDPHPDRVIINATDYITGRLAAEDVLATDKRARVINLCRNYDYMSRGYYCSLLAEARQQKCIPSAQNIINLHWKRLSQTSLPELNTLLERTFKASVGDQVAQTFLIYFGRTENADLQQIARRLFDIFRFPIMALTLKYQNTKWVVADVESWSLDEIPTEKRAFFNEALNMFTGAAWSFQKDNKKEKCWLAILHDPKEIFAPSNKTALQKFVKIGKQMNVFVELITRNDMPSLLEYDALLIRETTSIDHHTFRFAHKAESEGIPVIDDTASIIRCCNKVFLFELLTAGKVPVPRTLVLDKKSDRANGIDIPFPVVLKIPDGSFSRGVLKAEDQASLEKAQKTLFEKSDIILAQEFVPSTFDWRIGVLNGEALFACKYYMVQNHWQIYRHSEKGGSKEGGFECVALNDVPKRVMDVALKAARLVGDGLYGVDIKESNDHVYVIEVNDNPNIESGVDDVKEGDAIYRKIIQRLVDLTEQV